MKVLKWSLVFLILLSFCFAGCFGKDDENKNPIISDGDFSEFFSFATMKAGSWQELEYPNEERQTNKFIGTDTHAGKECYVIEIEQIYGGIRTIEQIWIEKATGKGAFMFTKDENGQVTKMDLSQFPDAQEDIKDFTSMPTGTVETGKTKYTTPTGKTVDCVIYKINTSFGESETWISNQVPFLSVKDTLNGEIIALLYDFGSSGATRSISKQEAENAKSINFGDWDFDDWNFGDWD